MPLQSPGGYEDLKVADIAIGRVDFSGSAITRVYAKASPLYAVYRTEQVTVQYADDPAVASDQRKLMVTLNGLRTEIDGMIDGWRKSRGAAFRDRAATYDSRVAAALRLCLENDGVTAASELAAIKADIIDERTSWGRFEYLLAAFAFSAVAIAAFFGLAHFRILKPETDYIWLAARAGIVGAFFSIALVISDRTVLTNLRRRDNIADAVLRISIGFIAAGLLATLIKANLLPDAQIGGVKLSKDIDWQAILTIGFCAGFFERFVPDLLKQGLTSDTTKTAKVGAAAPDAAPLPEKPKRAPAAAPAAAIPSSPVPSGRIASA
jgi:hypothetical protein